MMLLVTTQNLFVHPYIVHLYIKQLGHSLNKHTKFTLIDQVNNTNNTEKREDFWILKRDTLTPKGSNQEFNNV